MIERGTNSDLVIGAMVCIVSAVSTTLLHRRHRRPHPLRRRPRHPRLLRRAP
jgi:hypothetical protein